jgi:sporulation protein YlmC with PRC-barrel domain
MLRSLTALDDYTVVGSADGGHLGRIRDSYFDDRRWRIRHLVVETGHWPGHHRRLLSPWSVRWLDARHRVLQTDLTRQELADDPDADADGPVSRRPVDLAGYYGFYGFPYHWLGTVPVSEEWLAAGGGEAAVVTLAPPPARIGNPHLQSARAVLGYHVHARDDGVGHVSDFLFGDAAWAIRHVVVVLRRGLSRRRVLVPVGWVCRVAPDAGALSVALPGPVVRAAPEYDPAEPLEPDLEARLARYYGPPPFDAV